MSGFTHTPMAGADSKVATQPRDVGAESSAVSISPFDLQRASLPEYTAFANFHNRIRAEQLPDDPPLPVGEQIRRLQNIPPLMNMKVRAARNTKRTEVVASGGLDYQEVGENTNILNFRISVLPEIRRRSLGRRLLGLIVPVAVKPASSWVKI